MHVHQCVMIGGRWVAPSSDATYEVVSPSSEQIVGRVPLPAPDDVDAAVRAAREAFDRGLWSGLKPSKRADVLRQLADAIEARAEDLAHLVTLENGTPTAGSAMRISFSCSYLRAYADLAEQHDFVALREGYFGARAAVINEPVGVVAAITAWNSPMALMFMKLAPALAAGCTIVIKPALETALSAYCLADILASVEIPPGVVSVLPAGRAAGEQLVTHPGVDKVAFTGSTAVGKWILEHSAETMKRPTLELGGKSAAIMLEDVDIDDALGKFIPFAMGLAGQMCLLQSRLLVPHSRSDEIVELTVSLIRDLQVGDPFDPNTFMGPLISSRQRDRVEGYIASGIQEGATLVTGGGRPSHLPKGWYVEPTVFANVTNSMRIAREEIFGPVLSVIGYEDVDDAVRIANDSPFGLAGAVYTANPHEGLKVARRVHTGTFGINGYTSDPLIPFGGVKESGFGREGGSEGLSEFLETKSVFLPSDFDPTAVVDRKA